MTHRLEMPRATWAAWRCAIGLLVALVVFSAFGYVTTHLMRGLMR